MDEKDREKWRSLQGRICIFVRSFQTLMDLVLCGLYWTVCPDILLSTKTEKEHIAIQADPL